MVYMVSLFRRKGISLLKTAYSDTSASACGSSIEFEGKIFH